VPAPRRNNNGVSTIDERNENGAEEGEDLNASSRKINPLDFDSRRTRHKNQIEALKKALELMFPETGSAVVLLCWGGKSCCSILPVLVSNPEDEVTMWRELNEVWYTRRGYWRKRLPGFGITSVGIIEVCFNMLLLYEGALIRLRLLCWA
jgi:hypothetical protein